MGSRKEEQALAPHMPPSFKDGCPHCKSAWTVNRFEDKLQIVCNVCDRDRVRQGLQARWWANSGSYVTPATWAWEKLWRAFVQSVGLQNAIAMASAAGRQA